MKPGGRTRVAWVVVLDKVGLAAAIVLAILEVLLAWVRNGFNPLGLLAAVGLPFALPMRQVPYVAWLLLLALFLPPRAFGLIEWTLLFLVGLTLFVNQWLRLPRRD